MDTNMRPQNNKAEPRGNFNHLQASVVDLPQYPHPKVDATWARIRHLQADSAPVPDINPPNHGLSCPKCRSTVLIPRYQGGRAARILPCGHVFCLRCLDGQTDGDNYFGLRGSPILQVYCRHNNAWYYRSGACCPSCNFPVFHIGCGCPVAGVPVPKPEENHLVPATAESGNGNPAIGELCYRCNSDIGRRRLNSLFDSMFSPATMAPRDQSNWHHIPGYWRWITSGDFDPNVPEPDRAESRKLDVLRQHYKITDRGPLWTGPDECGLARGPAPVLDAPGLGLPYRQVPVPTEGPRNQAFEPIGA
ncbi:uncharacterized protein MKZ38_007242 [Zalerion maritima]|uniref:RING-type domain-containing protein n=1 Tax=Zalerion maritima TaxID=339359 RepID=A0AAD5WP79_9PEZI|nr:uncharacterized protein MKZ38_007242 [Zalerion maritima]